jgi:SAM-dependent methyltransferase
MNKMLESQLAPSAGFCRVCEAHGPMAPYILREVMFGSAETFLYHACGACGSMQIAEIPTDLHRHYPSNYYSLGGSPGSSFIRSIRAQGLRHGAGGGSLVGQVLSWVGRLPSDVLWLKACGADLKWSILDVGCGRGDRLHELSLAGFQKLQGIEPFIEHDIEVCPGVLVKRGTLHTLSEKFDLIMMHHSLEHVSSPVETMRDLERLLAESGKIILRVPVMGTWAWKTYGTDWVQLDAPRHLYQFTEKGMHALAASVGLHVRDIVYDSFDFQFYGSELVRDLRVNGKRTLRFTKTQMKDYKERAKELNKAADGDQACFILSR